jgi:signal transduction histidine kinase
MRIVREAVSNAIRHGHADSVTIRLGRPDGLHLTIEDNGAGLGAGEPAGQGFGLVSMRERAHALGGTVEVSPAPDGGVRVEVRLP